MWLPSQFFKEYLINWKNAYGGFILKAGQKKLPQSYNNYMYMCMLHALKRTWTAAVSQVKDRNQDYGDFSFSLY